MPPVNSESLLSDIEDLTISHPVSYHYFSAEERDAVRKNLLCWFDQEKREMPWRKPFDPEMTKEQFAQRAYEVWVSEIMLQQTQVATVIRYYNTWMEKWPTIHDLAKASLEEVNQIWAGLGYYSRAKRLLEGAQKVTAFFSGVLPPDAATLEKDIPGIGRYTAGAIASIAYNKKAALVDGNVMRVLARVRAVGGDTKSKGVIDLIWKLAEDLVPADRPGDFNQALMELGALVCTPLNPQCNACPIKYQCIALREKNAGGQIENEETEENICNFCEASGCEGWEVTRYPRKNVKKPPRDEECAVCILERRRENSSSFLLIKRPAQGLWAGLWEFPSVELSLGTATDSPPPPAKRRRRTDSLDCKKKSENGPEARAQLIGDMLSSLFGYNIMNNCARQEIGSVLHLFSHIRKVYHVEWVIIEDPTGDVEIVVEEGKNVDKQERRETRWLTREELNEAAIPTGMKKCLKAMDTMVKSKSKFKKSKDIRQFFAKK
ncbi:uncharacterized protein VTP21DRAFT_8719 [Calcarisporiella thermophila]|uniref:uncharacterized protein n=1 Tax=Calcarisporiella thermophila TaxID=911321 RepID=UPI003742FD87